MTAQRGLVPGDFSLPAWLSAGCGFLLDALLPPRCFSCGTETGRGGALCADCWARVRFIAPPLCACCGTPFELPADVDARCGACLTQPPRFARARAVFVYDQASRSLVLDFKHGDRTDAAQAFGAWLARAGADLLQDADLLVPVPLHRWRLFRRRYNQAALLAFATSRASGVPAVADVLARRRATASQGHLSRAGRRRNVAHAFHVRPQRTTLVSGRRIVLIDDVLTTGATAAECAAALLRAGAARVEVLTLARVVRAQETQ
jgi:ComF family protein